MDNYESARQLIRLALEEDIGAGDLTALAVPPDVRACAQVIAKEDTVVSGLELGALVLETFGADAKVSFGTGMQDGAFAPKGAVLLELGGRARDLLTLERTLMNLLQRTCGVASQARRFREALGGAPLTILDTRKTAPGLRAWDKKAVRDGGLTNHRSRLDEAVLIKENHIRASGSITLALANLQGKIPPGTAVEVEITNWDEAKEAMDCGVTRLLLDNFKPTALRELVPRLRGNRDGLYLEASGGVTFSNVRDYAGIGLDAVSVGALTHSVPAADLSFLFLV